MNRTDQATNIISEIAAKTDHLQRLVADVEPRYERAADAVGFLCAEIARYLDPHDAEVGYNRLAEARMRVLQQHSGNFSSDMAPAAGPGPATDEPPRGLVYRAMVEQGWTDRQIGAAMDAASAAAPTEKPGPKPPRIPANDHPVA